MDQSIEKKRLLLTRWIQGHIAGNSAPLFTHLAPDYVVTEAATALLKRPVPPGTMSLYLVCLAGAPGVPMPVYIGKAIDPWQRWSTGHLRGLRQAAQGQTSTLYDQWVAAFALAPRPLSLLCLAAHQVRFAPLPDFPTTIGSVEYQLVALADALPMPLLNHEGAAR